MDQHWVPRLHRHVCSVLGLDMNYLGKLIHFLLLGDSGRLRQCSSEATVRVMNSPISLYSVHSRLGTPLSSPALGACQGLCPGRRGDQEGAPHPHFRPEPGLQRQSRSPPCLLLPSCWMLASSECSDLLCSLPHLCSDSWHFVLLDSDHNVIFFIG